MHLKKTFLIAIGPLLFLGAFLFLRSSKSQSQGKSSAFSDAPGWPDARNLMRHLRKGPKLVFVYSENDAATAQTYRKNLKELANRMKWFPTEIQSETDMTEQQLHTSPLLLVGTRFTNQNIVKMLGKLPLDFTTAKIRIDTFQADQRSDVLVLSGYPNPLNRKVPIFVVTGNDADALARQILNPGYQLLHSAEFSVVRNGRTVQLGFFEQQSKGAPWTINTDRTRNYAEKKSTATETAHYLFSYIGRKMTAQTVVLLAGKQEKRMAAALVRLGLISDNSPAIPKIHYYLYDSLEDKGLITGNTDLSHFDSTNWSVHAVSNTNLRGTDFFSDANLLALKILGPTQSTAMRDGLAMVLTDHWGHQGYKYWAKRIFDAGQANDLNEILDSGIYKKESYLFMRPLAGSFVEFLLQKYGPKTFFALYKSWPASGVPDLDLPDFTTESLARAWHEELKKPPEASIAVVEPSRQPVFQKGFCYAHEGYQIHNGYLSRTSERSLAKLGSLGVDWVSITPFGFLEKRNTPGYFRFSRGAGSENDESVLAAFYAARKAGMRTMLKPHVLMASRNFGWPGEIKMKNREDWQAFFDYYSRWIRHYALLAEMYKIDMFCIGVELLHATDGHGREWRRLIRDVRKIYHGPIVYAANWWREFEQIDFWDELDYIGLNCYYPLSTDDEVTLAKLKAGINKFLPSIEKTAKRYQKPLILTEVGFTSTAQNWKQPHERRRGAPVSLTDQALCYRAIFESFWDKKWFAGFYWWKWPTYLDYGGEDNSGFTPNGKPAEKVVAEWYSKKPGSRSFLNLN